jgi:hypothetical protein
MWGAMYVIAAATAAAVAFYFPEDLVALSGSLMPTDGPPYLFAALVCVPIVALGYASGSIRARDDEKDDLRFPLDQ